MKINLSLRVEFWLVTFLVHSQSSGYYALYFLIAQSNRLHASGTHRCKIKCINKTVVLSQVYAFSKSVEFLTLGSDWDGDNSPHSSPYSAVVLTGSYKGVDNTPAFWLLLGSAHSIRGVSPTLPLSSWLGVSKILGGGRARTADPNRPEGYSYCMMSAQQ